MTEQDIDKERARIKDDLYYDTVVEAVLRQMKGITGSRRGQAVQPNESHNTCMCRHWNMTLAAANALIERVKEKAEEMGIQVVVAVADEGARPVAVQRMDGAYLASFDIALCKTFTAAGLRMSTAELAELSRPGEPLYGIQHSNDGKIVVFGGGEPLMLNGKLVGAVGVSGGSVLQDTALAAYGKEIFEEVIACL